MSKISVRIKSPKSTFNELYAQPSSTCRNLISDSGNIELQNLIGAKARSNIVVWKESELGNTVDCVVNFGSQPSIITNFKLTFKL